MTSALRPQDYFRCPRCQGPLLCDSDLRCSKCGALFAMHDGIANFIAEGVETKLDDLDYDAFYKVDLGTSQEAFRQLKQAVDDRIGDHYGSLLEIGAGTGGLTYGLLTTLSVDHALITDIS